MLTYDSLAMYRPHQQSSQQPMSPSVPQHPVPNGQQHSPEDGLQQYWYGYPHGHPHSAHHQSPPGPQQYLNPSDVLTWPHTHTHHYSHLQYQHHTFPNSLQHPLAGVVDWSSDEGNNPSNIPIVNEPSPPITISGSEVSSPGTPSTPPVNSCNNVAHNNGSNTPIRPSQIRSPYEWMKKPSYQTQPNPGKTRTKDKYRVVYTDHQRLELEKEFHYSRYITIRRKAELATNLSLSERQVKIWFQNRRAKERKQSKKREEKDVKPTTEELAGSLASLRFSGMSSMFGSLMQNETTHSHPHPHPHPHPLALGHPPGSAVLHAAHHNHNSPMGL